MNNSYALITGASSGIGLEIAKNLASKGFNLVITARREERLKKISNEISHEFNVHVDFIAVDLSHIDAPSNIFTFCSEKNYKVEVLINNAGYGIKTPFHETSMEDEENFIRVLGTSVIALTKIFLPSMIKENKGKIMIVSSVASFSPPSSIQALYGPIKTFMNRFSDSININYNHKGITSTALCPGFTVTEFHTASGVQDEMDRVPSFLKFSAKRIAQEGVDAMLSGKQICVPTKTYKTLVFLLKILPMSALSKLGSKIAPGRYDQN
ncbi:MAG: SDR family NAD(P)-dependent oxidoreductase [Proteobacteria bacterium]|jgi:short-subunit dehydrogenase|nr:SDR family NAD(P)-dependent oxidoreductase [Pseudomonadota bacterium]NCX10868.1 SDR family NAD(P)-dependent oxidoreductase [Pseudomonadota bacterium]NCX34501.1 SDR family NAD(P)-dependent oxidoreductase [Pseudomonadota bacterium]